MESKEDKKAREDVIDKWGRDYYITKAMGTEVVLSTLKENQAVCYGDGKTYHFVLTKKINPPMDKRWGTPEGG